MVSGELAAALKSRRRRRAVGVRRCCSTALIANSDVTRSVQDTHATVISRLGSAITAFSGCQRICAGDEHWTKVLQANDVLGRLSVCPYHGKTLPQRCAFNADAKTTSPAAADQVAEPGDRACRRQRPDATETTKDRTVLTTLFDRFCQWLSESRRPSSLLRLPLSKARSRRSSSLRRSPDVDDDDGGPSSVRGRRCHSRRRRSSTPPSSSSLGDLTSDRATHRTGSGSRETSTCSSVTTGTSTSSACSYAVTGTASTGRSVTSACSGSDVRTSDFFEKSTSRRESSVKDDCSPLISTWPSTNEECSSGVHTDCRNFDNESFHYHPDAQTSLQDTTNRNPGDEQQLRDSLMDWNIPFVDLRFKDCFKAGLRSRIYSGRWHGDVLIHTFDNQSDAEVLEFLRDVANLSRIRHESICLFMGACLQSPDYAIVTSELKGCSLYERLHLTAEKVPLRSRVSIGRQVAQALGYLHAKSISARCLSSRNVYLEPKVKLSVLDHAIADTNCARAKSLNLPRGAMCYLAPEVLSTMRPIAYRTMSALYAFNAQTDVFAFGTLLYELVSGEFPWRGLRPEETMWLVMNGDRQSLATLGCNSVLKVLIEKCWMHNAEERPDFAEINQELQSKTGLHKRHSSSQPARLDRYGSGSSRTFCIK